MEDCFGVILRKLGCWCYCSGGDDEEDRLLKRPLLAPDVEEPQPKREDCSGERQSVFESGNGPTAKSDDIYEFAKKRLDGSPTPIRVGTIWHLSWSPQLCDFVAVMEERARRLSLRAVLQDRSLMEATHFRHWTGSPQVAHQNGRWCMGELYGKHLVLLELNPRDKGLAVRTVLELENDAEIHRIGLCFRGESIIVLLRCGLLLKHKPMTAKYKIIGRMDVWIEELRGLMNSERALVRGWKTISLHCTNERKRVWRHESVGWINCMAIEPSETQLALGVDSPFQCLLMDLSTGRVNNKINLRSDPISLAFSPRDQALVAVAENKGGLRVWNTRKRSEVSSFLSRLHSECRDLTWSADGTVLFAVNDDRCFSWQVYDAGRRSELVDVRRVRGNKVKELREIRVAPDQSAILIRDASLKVFLLRRRNSKEKNSNLPDIHEQDESEEAAAVVQTVET